MAIEASMLLKKDYLNEYSHVLVHAYESREANSHVWPSDLKVAKFWEKYAKFNGDIILTFEDNQKISQLDDLADQINPLLGVEPKDMRRIVELSISACQICSASDSIVNNLNTLLQSYSP